jgi:ABC-2 type transport system ATP-binding protein
MARPLLLIEGLRKTYRGNWIVDSKVAVRDASFEVAAGEIVGLLGPNGSGKSTTFKCVTGLVRPSAGRIELLGLPPSRREARERLGFLPEDASFHDFLTGEEFVDMAARLSGVPGPERKGRVDAILSRVGLADARRRRIRTYSKGMAQRVGIAQAIVGSPDLVILDEPMTGLDPIGRREVRDLIGMLGHDGAGVIFATHILQDVELVCDRVVIMAAGRVLRQGTLAELLAGEQGGPVEITVQGVGAEKIGGEPGAEIVSRAGDTLVLRAGDAQGAERLAEATRRAGGHVIALQPVARRLEDVFLREVAAAGAGT